MARKRTGRPKGVQRKTGASTGPAAGKNQAAKKSAKKSGANWQSVPAELRAEFDAMVEQLAGAERRQMFGCPCAFTRTTRQLFTGLHESTWLVRLPPEAREELRELGGEPFAPMDRPMTEYMLLPDAIYADPVERLFWVRRALAFAESLPVKVKKPRKKK